MLGTEGYKCWITAIMIDIASGKMYEGLQPPLRPLMSPKSWKKCPLTKLNILQEDAVKDDQGDLLELVQADAEHDEGNEYEKAIFTAIAKVSTRVTLRLPTR